MPKTKTTPVKPKEICPLCFIEIEGRGCLDSTHREVCRKCYPVHRVPHQLQEESVLEEAHEAEARQRS